MDVSSSECEQFGMVTAALRALCGAGDLVRPVSVACYWSDGLVYVVVDLL